MRAERVPFAYTESDFYMTPTLRTEGEAMRTERVDKEKNRLEDIFNVLEPEEMDVAQGLMDEVAFMRVTLQDLKEEKNENRTVDIMPQVEYAIKRQSPEVQTYNTMIQRYNATYKELFNLLPKEKGDLIDEEFDSF